MAYYLNLFSPETYEVFSKSNREVTGFRFRQLGHANKIEKGDKLICYVTKVSKWCGVLEVMGNPYVDHKPLFLNSDDPFVVRFKVNPIIWLSLERSIPVQEDAVWKNLSFTKSLPKQDKKWGRYFMASLVKYNEEDGLLLVDILNHQLS